MQPIDDRDGPPSTVPLAVGQILELERKFSQADFDRFARLSGDDNPIHVDPAFASRSRFGRTVAHGMLLYSAVEAALGRLAPAAPSISQTLKFPTPTYGGEPVRIRLEVTALNAASGLTTVATTVIRPDGVAGLEGEAVLGPSNPDRIANSGDAGEPPPKPPATSPGPRAELRRSFDLAELAEYASLAGGSSLLAELPPTTVPGGLLGSLFSCLLGTQLPGRGANYLKQRLEFHRPARPLQELVASVEVIRVRPDKHLVNLSTLCTNVAGEVICSGEALVLVSDLASVVMSHAAGGSRAQPILTEENRP
jgi:acyl dehydratase